MAGTLKYERVKQIFDCSRNGPNHPTPASQEDGMVAEQSSTSNHEAPAAESPRALPTRRKQLRVPNVRLILASICEENDQLRQRVGRLERKLACTLDAVGRRQLGRRRSI